MDTVLVTGASSGIGRSIVEFLAGHGIDILATARSDDDLAELAAMDRVDSVFLDVTIPASIEKLVTYIHDQEIHLSALVNNAGILVMGLAMTTPENQIAELFDVNVFGVIRMTRALLPFLVKTGGRIVNISSDSGLVSFPYSVYYNMTKFAIEAYSDGLAEELSEHGVDVCLIEPGNIATGIMKKSLARIQDPLSENAISVPGFSKPGFDEDNHVEKSSDDYHDNREDRDEDQEAHSNDHVSDRGGSENKDHGEYVGSRKSHHDMDNNVPSFLPFLAEQHRRTTTLLDAAVEEFMESTDPQEVAHAVHACLTTESPARRYFVGTTDELKHAIDTLLDRVVSINKSHPGRLADNSLHDRLSFILNYKS